jgi:VCBS repeat-containing protein
MSSKNNGNNGNGNNPANKTWEDEWHHGGTTDKVAGQTGAAKDESFTVNNADSIILDVLANDPGSAHLWSIDQDALAGPDYVHVPRAVDDVVLPSGARLSINADGTLNYIPPASVADLPEGETFTDSFTYVIRMANGALSSAQATVAVQGTAPVPVEEEPGDEEPGDEEPNTPATITGDLEASVDEDGESTTVGGTLQVVDPDAGEAAFAAVGDLQGAYGVFSFDLESGVWSYVLDNDKAEVQQLNSGESVQDSLLVETVDGSTATITVTINGQDEVVPDPVGERWLLSLSSLERESDGATANVLTLDVTEQLFIIGGRATFGFQGLGFMELPNAPTFGYDDVLVYSNMDYFDPFYLDINNDGIEDTTAVNFYYTQQVDGAITAFNVFVVLIGFTDFDPLLHLEGVKDNVPV